MAPNASVRRPGARAAALALLTAGCAIGPNYHRPVTEPPAAWKEAGAADASAAWQDARPRETAPRGEWWAVFQDPALSMLEVQAVQANLSVEAALARLERARAAARLPQADLLPAVSANPSYTHFQRTLSSIGGAGTITGDDFQVPFDLSYEVDLWGKVRRSFEAAHADAQASQSAYEGVLLSVTAEVARLYFGLRALDAEQLTLQRTVELRLEAQRLIDRRAEAGLSSELDRARVTAEVKTAEVESLEVERRRAELEHALAVLCGRAPAEFSVPAAPLEVDPPQLPAGLPSTVLERRPDVAEAERLMAAANARIGVAQAAFFPVVSLAGSAGWQAAELDQVLRADSVVWSLGPSVSVPLFAGGRNAANLRAARADHTQASAEYRRRVLTAFQEVEDALTAIRVLAGQQQAQREVVEASQRAHHLSIDRYTQGLVNFLDAVDAERARLEAERRAAQIRGARMAASILLIKALGGGWDAPPAP